MLRTAQDMPNSVQALLSLSTKDVSPCSALPSAQTNAETVADIGLVPTTQQQCRLGSNEDTYTMKLWIQSPVIAVYVSGLLCTGGTVQQQASEHDLQLTTPWNREVD